MQIKTSNNKQFITLSKSEWIQIGKQSGWIKQSQKNEFPLRNFLNLEPNPLRQLAESAVSYVHSEAKKLEIQLLGEERNKFLKYFFKEYQDFDPR